MGGISLMLPNAERVSVVVRYSAQRELETFIMRTIIAYLMLCADRRNDERIMKIVHALY